MDWSPLALQKYLQLVDKKAHLKEAEVFYEGIQALRDSELWQFVALLVCAVDKKQVEDKLKEKT